MCRFYDGMRKTCGKMMVSIIIFYGYLVLDLLVHTSGKRGFIGCKFREIDLASEHNPSSIILNGFICVHFDGCLCA